MNTYRKLLKEFKIDTTNVFIDGTNIRTKDNMKSIGFCFKIQKPKNILNFATYIGFDTKDKKERLQKAFNWVRMKMGG